jgi:hypothetical protein
VLCIEHHGDDLGPAKAQEDVEVIAVSRNQPRALRVGRVKLLLVVVVLNQRERLIERGLRNERCSDPVMDQAVGDGNAVPLVLSLKPLDHDFAARQPLMDRSPPVLGQAANPEERTGSGLMPNPDFSQRHIMIKHLGGGQLLWQRRERRENQSRECRDPHMHTLTQMDESAPCTAHKSHQNCASSAKLLIPSHFTRHLTSCRFD